MVLYHYLDLLSLYKQNEMKNDLSLWKRKFHCSLTSLFLLGAKTCFKYLMTYRIASIFNVTISTEKDCPQVQLTESSFSVSLKPHRFLKEVSSLSWIFPEHLCLSFWWTTWVTWKKTKSSTSRSGEVACLWNLTMMCPSHLLSYRRPSTNRYANPPAMQ